MENIMKNKKKVVVATIEKAAENIPTEPKKDELLVSCYDYLRAKEQITEINKQSTKAKSLKKTAESFLLDNLGDITLNYNGYNFLVKQPKTTVEVVEVVDNMGLIDHVKKEKPELMKGFTQITLDRDKLVEYVTDKYPQVIEKFQNEVLTDSFGLIEKLKETEPELVSQFTKPDTIERTTQAKLSVVKGKK